MSKGDMMQTTWREELAWAAGFFDGEGWTGTISNNGEKHYARMAIHQVHLPSLERFQRAVLGLGRIGGPYDHSGGRNKPIYKWQVTNYAEVQAVGVLLIGFLAAEKADQWTAAMRKATFTYHGSDRCSKGHEQAKYRNKHGQCRECLRIYAADRRAAARSH